MIIRSQDKKRISNIGNCNLIAIVSSQGTSQNITVDGMVVGTYSTDEKALKVLDMIQDAYCKMKSSDCIFCGSSIDLCKTSQEKIDNFIETNRKLYVFDMPQDSEV